MAFRIDNDVEFFATVAGGTGGTGNLIIGDAVSVNRRTPSGVMSPGDTMIIKSEEAGQHETTLCTLLSSTEMARTRVIDRWDRTGALNTPIESLNLAKVAFSSGQLICGNTIPQPMNIVLQPDGTFAYGDAIRATVFFDLIEDIQDPLSDISNGQVVMAVSGLVAGDQLGGLFLYDADGDNGTIDNLSIFAPGTVGAPRPGILIRQHLDISAFFFREDLSIYAPTTGSILKQHTLAQGVAGAADAWMGSRVARGTNGDGAYTDHELVARDRQASVVPFARSRSFGSGFDKFEVLKPLGLPSAAQKSDIKPGTLARVETADKKIWYYDADRGIGEIPLIDSAWRAIVGNVAALRALTPDGYRDGERVLVAGSTARGDDFFEVEWSSGSSTADNNVDVFKPTLHDDGAPWVDAGRFLAVAPIRAIKFADEDATPSVAGSTVFTAADVSPPGGITAFDDFRNNKRIKLQPGAADVVIKQANGALELPGRVDFTLRSIANGGWPVIFEKENGVVSMIAGGVGAVDPTVVVITGSVPDNGALGAANMAAWQAAANKLPSTGGTLRLVTPGVHTLSGTLTVPAGGIRLELALGASYTGGTVPWTQRFTKLLIGDFEELQSTVDASDSGNNTLGAMRTIVQNGLGSNFGERLNYIVQGDHNKGVFDIADSVQAVYQDVPDGFCLTIWDTMITPDTALAGQQFGAYVLEQNITNRHADEGYSRTRGQRWTGLSILAPENQDFLAQGNGNVGFDTLFALFIGHSPFTRTSDTQFTKQYNGIIIDDAISPAGVAILGIGNPGAAARDPKAVIDVVDNWGAGFDFRDATFRGIGFIPANVAVMMGDSQFIAAQATTGGGARLLLGESFDRTFLGTIDATEGVQIAGPNGANIIGRWHAAASGTTDYPTLVAGNFNSELRTEGSNTNIAITLRPKGDGDVALALGAAGSLKFNTLPGNYVNDAAAAAAGVSVGDVYRNGSVLMIRAA